MHGALTFARRSASPGILFAEDFDDPSAGEAEVQEIAPGPAEPEVIEPVFSESELAAACQQAREAGLQQGLRQAEAATERKMADALAAIAAALADAQRVARDMAAEAAEHLARTVLAALNAALPHVCARYGDEEVQGLIAALMPSLDDEPGITIRLCPETCGEMQNHVRRIAPATAGRVTLIEDATLSPGDVRVEWRNGQARRDTRLILSEIGRVLNAQGLLDAGPAGEGMQYAE